MNNYRNLFLGIFLITLLSLIYLIIYDGYRNFYENYETSNYYFRATSDELLNIHNIQPIGYPWLRGKTLKAFSYQISKKERLIFYKILDQFNWIMKEYDIQYFISGETLMGSYKNHDFLPWGDSVYISIALTQRMKLENLYDKFKSYNLIIYITETHDILYLGNESISFYDDNWKWPYIDITFYDVNSTHIYDITQTNFEIKTFPKSIIFPLSIRPFFVHNYPTPKDSFAYIVWSFGFTDMCKSRSKFSKYAETKCSKFINKYPYIRRYENSDGIVEELINKNNVIQRIKVNEPLYAVSESFSMKLKPGYVYPYDIILPVN